MTDLSPEDQAAIQGGLEAETLLGMPFFVKMLEDLTLSTALEILEIDPDDLKGSEKRERLYWKSVGLQDLQAEVHGRVARKAEVLDRLEQLAELEDQ